MNLDGLEDTRLASASAKAEEARAEQGGLVSLNVVLPSGSTSQFKFPAGVTVAYVKLQVELQHQLPAAQQVLKVDGKTLMDPFSLCDYPALQPGTEATVTVELS